ncbi:MAG: hypothetical protein IPM46_10205 [Flavobacteriales bacterium]|nr:hypothetical protein [Flavobacteriales bacterium]
MRTNHGSQIRRSGVVIRNLWFASIIISLVACTQDSATVINSNGQGLSASLVTICDTTWNDQGYYATDNCVSTLIIGEDSISFIEQEVCPYRLCIGESEMITLNSNDVYMILFDCQLIKYSMLDRAVQKRVLLGQDELKRGCEECSLTSIGDLIVYQCKSKVSLYSDDLTVIYNSDKDGARVVQGYLTYSHPELDWDSRSIYITQYATDPLDSLVVIGIDTISQ